MTSPRDYSLAKAGLGCLLVALVIAFLWWGAAGCQQAPSGSITLALIPAYEAPSDARTFTGQQVALQAQQMFPLSPVTYVDATYSLVSYSWLQKFLDWEWRAAKSDGISYTPESFDCDDFALGFQFFAHRAAARAGLKTSPLVARISVQIPQGLHMLNAVVTDAGIFVVEPQPDAGAFRITPLAKYKGNVLQIAF